MAMILHSVSTYCTYTHDCLGSINHSLQCLSKRNTQTPENILSSCVKNISSAYFIATYVTLSVIPAGSSCDPQSVFVSFTHILIGHDVVEDTEILILLQAMGWVSLMVSLIKHCNNIDHECMIASAVIITIQTIFQELKTILTKTRLFYNHI